MSTDPLVASDHRPELSPTARQLFVEADSGLHRVLVSSIALIEMVDLIEGGRLAPEPVEQLFRLLGTIDGSYAVAALTLDIARSLQNVPRFAVPDRPDRIIVATARQLGLELINRDEIIQRAAIVPVLW